MWPFSRKKSLLARGFLRGWTDWHSHILPGVDDGIPSPEAALEVLRWYESQGVREVWLTPHVMEDYPNTPAGLQARFEDLQRLWTGSVRLHLAAEHMLDALFEERLKQGELLPIGEAGDRLLIETSYYNAPMNFAELLEQVKARGFHPLLAHPERYFYMEETDYHRLHDSGVEFQLNLPSLCGMYGEAPARKARFLLKAGYYTCSGSDLHSLGAFRASLATPVRPIQF
ncbi:MAG: tyrosine-protein phosphatase [Bacteroidales bacterium]